MKRAFVLYFHTFILVDKVSERVTLSGDYKRNQTKGKADSFLLSTLYKPMKSEFV